MFRIVRIPKDQNSVFAAKAMKLCCCPETIKDMSLIHSITLGHDPSI